MLLNPDSMKPIYIQIAEWLEGEILAGRLKADERIYSQYQLAEMFNINPATAAKGLNILADGNVVYKKRGLGMFVSASAPELVRSNRRERVLEPLILDLLLEAGRLGVDEDRLLAMVRQAGAQMKEGNA